jgi:hypothetical protein
MRTDVRIDTQDIPRGAGGETSPRRSVRMQRPHGEWRSLVAHSAGGRAVAGSNPVSPIIASPLPKRLCLSAANCERGTLKPTLR